ncbi:MAG TPA: triose-phosphate isomerase, partial [Desertimonas sp.]|nr:triose-phosphate isomerase [Desertimonas sp.]
MPEARKPIIAGNWKMHHDHLVAIQVVQKLTYRLEAEDYEECDVVVCPPFTDLRTLQTLIQADKLKVRLGAQNCHWENQGAYTGEVAPPMLAKLAIEFVIVGHSERRSLFGETDEMVNRKLRAVLAQGMTPIVCVGETLEEREAGATEGKVLGQVAAAFAGV